MYNIIVNPASKSGKGRKLWNQVEAILQEENAEYQVHFTKHVGDATKLAEELTSNLTKEVTLIVLGGDGTMNEVISGIVDFGKTTLGYIPTGSSNDLARDMKISKHPKEALDAILHCKRIARMDMGEITYRYGVPGAEGDNATKTETKRFAVSAGIGFDADVCEGVMHTKAKKFFNKIGLGKLVYLFIALKKLMSSPAIPCRIAIDDREPITLSKFLFVAGMVHKYEGGGFMFCPHALYNDGELEVCVVGDVSRGKILRVLPSAFKGKHLKHKNIDEYRGKRIVIDVDEPVWLHTDGEVPAKVDHVEMTCIADQLKLYH